MWAKTNEKNNFLAEGHLLDLQNKKEKNG